MLTLAQDGNSITQRCTLGPSCSSERLHGSGQAVESVETKQQRRLNTPHGCVFVEPWNSKLRQMGRLPALALWAIVRIFRYMIQHTWVPRYTSQNSVAIKQGSSEILG